jgi:hypothetical protein
MSFFKYFNYAYNITNIVTHFGAKQIEKKKTIS